MMAAHRIVMMIVETARMMLMLFVFRIVLVIGMAVPIH